MEIPAKNVDVKNFVEGSDSDTGQEYFPSSRQRYSLNFRRTTLGDKGLGTNILGNLLIAAGYATGNNIGLGYGIDQQNNKIFYFNWNDQGYHGIYMFDAITLNVTPVIQNLIDTNNVDILKFDQFHRINHFDITYVQNDITNQANTLIYWIDGLNKGRKTNVQKCLDKTATGYGTVITEDYITAYKQTSVYAPTACYFTDTTRTSNYVYGQQFKFAVRPYYDDNEIGNWSDWSGVPVAHNEDFQGQDTLKFTNNCIQIKFETGSKLVIKWEIGMLSTSISPILAGEAGVTIPWVSVIILSKLNLPIVDDALYTYSFYNDGSYGDVDQGKIARQFSFMPRVPKIQSLVKIALVYGNFYEGFPSVSVSISIALTFTPFYLPADTVPETNKPSITITLISVTDHGGLLFHDSYLTSLTTFVIGEDVIKGNTFVVNAFGGNTSALTNILLGGAFSRTNSGNSSFSYTAGIADTATTVASAIKQWLRSISSVGAPVISNEVTDIDGNVSWEFAIEAHEGKNAITFSGSVNPVNYVTLLDNGLSVNTKKMGSVEKYAVVYVDDDGRESNGNTSDSCLVDIPFETEILPGQTAPIGLQQPIVTITIMHLPPAWAKYYKLVRTSGPSTFIQILIQQVNKVVVENESTYLDLIVGSLFTYQKVHPDTILAYQFSRGDRLRLISDESTTPPTPYVPFFETEILSYIIDEEEFVDSNIICNGTNNVTPSIKVDPNKIGKYIIINNFQRIITGISGSSYVLDEPINPNTNDFSTSVTLTSNTFPNFTFKDTRGIIRINIPPSTITVNAMAKVEVIRPQQNVDNQDYQNFFDFQKKFPILNWGTANAAHIGNLNNNSGTPNQDPANPSTSPAIIQVTKGDAWVRNRAMPSSNQDPDPQVIIDMICDPNFNDFYASALYNTGKVYPQDRGYGQVTFNQRVRFSNNFIQNTQVNGLNDFDELDYMDYNDPYGSIILAKFKRGVLYLFKQLKSCWTQVLQKIIVDNAGNQTLATSDDLLNELQYAEWEGGIGDNPEGFVEDGDFMYIPSANSGVFLRIGQDGSIPISELYLYDKRSKELLNFAQTHKLQIPGGFDKANGEVIWTVPDFIANLFNNQFNASDWNTFISAYPAGTTWTVTQQPANSTATVVGNQIQITDTNTLGNDYFKFQGTLPDTSLTPIVNFCFTVIAAVNRVTAWRVQSASIYCLQGLGVNNGQQGWQILEQYYPDDNTTSGLIKPNSTIISPSAIVPNTANITYNQAANVTPVGGANGDVWYNLPENILYKQTAGVWTPLNDTAVNSDYAPPITNITDCPLPTPPIGNNWTLSASYDVEIVSVVDGTSSGTPVSFASANVPSGSTKTDVYTTQTSGTIEVQFSGTPMPSGHVKCDLVVNGIVVDTKVITSTFPIFTFTFPVTVNDPTSISLQINSF